MTLNVADRNDPRSGAFGPLALGDWIKKLVPKAEPERDALASTLTSLLDPSIAADARVVSLRRGTATVEVSSSCLLHELRTLRHTEILEAFQKAIDSITVRKLVFRLASSNESS
ncbi:MAG: DUF721 domain-containing protein [Planctomycetes bacterium]|nr:DUF721 domain-containing protein [Planctomycetota bacterium]